MMRGVRARLTATIVALVVLTAIVLGVGSYVFVDLSVHERFLRESADQARFDLIAVVPGRSEDELQEIFRTRVSQLVIDDGDGGADSFVAGLAPALRELGARELAYQWTTLASTPMLIVGGRLPPDGPTYYFARDATDLEASLGTLRVGLVIGAAIVAVLALVAARWVARGVLRPVDEASRAAARLERGDLGARIAVASGDEFGRWAERFNQMADSLQDTIERLEVSQDQNRRFVADVSHELRTPLTALVAEASILREHLAALPPDARRTGELLVGDVARLRTLVEELMELSRFDAATELVAPEAVELGELVRRILAARAPEASLQAPDVPLVVQSEPRRLERILGNLLDNAREHAPGVPPEVVVRREADAAVIEVLDRGPGVPADGIDRIFERFYKVDPSRRGGSSGLGLAIAAEHAAVVGGRLAAEHREGGGLRISLRLPVTEPLPAGDERATDELQSGTPVQSTREIPS